MAQKQDGFVVFEVREHQVSTSVPHLASDHRNLSLLPPFRLKPAPFFLLQQSPREKPFFLLQQSPATSEIRSFNCREVSGEGSWAGSAVPEQSLGWEGSLAMAGAGWDWDELWINPNHSGNL